MTWTQDEHKLLLIPGPVEVHDEVLLANAHPSMSHVSPVFAPSFAYCLKGLRKLLYTNDGQPFVIAGSGTLGWDLVASNLIEAGEKALVLNSGYFGDAFADCLETYGAKVTQVKAPVGGRPSLDEIEAALKKDDYKLLTFTHVDTSTGVLSDAKAIGELVHRISPSTFVILDGVCSVASEEIRFDEWHIDAVIGASQKGLSAPPGLSVTCISQRALAFIEERKTPIPNYFANYKRWLPIMKSYEDLTPAYFATPPVNLIYALEASLKQILEGNPSLEERFALHKQASQKFKTAAKELGFNQVSIDPETGANGMTALYVPEGITAPALIGALGKRGIIIAGGLHKEIKTKYVRFGHLGLSVHPSRNDVTTLIKALEESFEEIKSASN